MSDTPTSHLITPEEIQRFWNRGASSGTLADVPIANTPALRRLGPSPFPGASFPVLGFLETVYEQVASHGSAQSNPKEQNRHVH